MCIFRGILYNFKEIRDSQIFLKSSRFLHRNDVKNATYEKKKKKSFEKAFSLQEVAILCSFIYLSDLERCPENICLVKRKSEHTVQKIGFKQKIFSFPHC
jgi:hypothetical protein